MNRVHPLLSLALLALFLAAPLAAEEDRQPIAEVLALGSLPVSAEHFEQDAKSAEMRRALFMQISRGELPSDGARLSLFGQPLSWQAAATQDVDVDGVSLLAFNLEADRFVRGKLEVAGLKKPRLFHEGSQREPADGAFELSLAAGTHVFLLLHQGVEDDVRPELHWAGRQGHDQVRSHVEPRRRVSARLLTNADTVGAMAISPDGRYLALSWSGRDDAADVDLSRMEIHDLNEQRIVRQWTASPPSSLAWSPDGRTLAVHEGNHVWLHRSSDGQARLLLANHERIGAWRWHPNGESLVFSWTEPDKDDNEKRRRIRSLEDRWATFRDNSQLYQVDVASGLIRPLTARKQSVTLHDIDPAGERLLLSERLIDYAEPPHSLFRLFELNLASLEEREIAQLRLFNGALFADEGYWLLAGPGLAQGDGSTTGEDLTPNEYDTQLYRLSDDGETARSVSRDFDPAFGGMHRLPNGDLLLTATAGERAVLVRFEAGRERLAIVDAGVEMVEQFVASEGRRPVVVVRGSDADSPQRVVRVDQQRNRAETLVDTRPSQYAGVTLGPVVPWSFTNDSGDEIEGRYYLPPDFDADQSYPMIVYYYGGTTPVGRAFTGRYPFNLWAAKGYVVYVLQPRGTIGYGQDLSALHVNAWGQYTAEDIIEGTRKFVKAHAFIDGDRIGNIGASYGGFMTMHLATLTDIFAASISHAGISALTSYWGQGWWGYGYSGIASRGSFPWNDPELYVGQSPVYSADRITTPLLLVTGDSDTNVPPGESHNMYTALKLLGRDVELIEFPGQDHWIVDREQRYVWWDTMLAWFDYWLKDEPQWWHHLYPETAPDS